MLLGATPDGAEPPDPWPADDAMPPDESMPPPEELVEPEESWLAAGLDPDPAELAAGPAWEALLLDELLPAATGSGSEGPHPETSRMPPAANAVTK